jgi:hypothetical protein
MRTYFLQCKKAVSAIFSYLPSIPNTSKIQSGKLLLGLVWALALWWGVEQFVLADKVSHVYVFPNSVASERWDNATNGLAQELSSAAELVDFSKENSATVRYISEDVTALSSSSTPLSGNLHEEGSLQNQEEAAQTSEIPASSIPSAPEAIQSSDDIAPIPLQESSVDSPTPDLLNPFVPNMEVNMPLLDGVSTTALWLWEELGTWVTPKSVLALDTPTSTEVESLEPPANLDDVGYNLHEAQTEVFGSNTPEVVTPMTVEDFIEGAQVEEGVTALTTETATHTPQLIAPESSDPYAVSLCKTLGKECHLMVYSGFGLGGVMSGHKPERARVEVSLAGRGAFSATVYDRVLVRAYHAGKWVFLGELVIRGELSNGKRGGYVSFPLEQFSDWSSLDDVQVVLEYDRESAEDASVYVDGVWIDAEYTSDEEVASDETEIWNQAHIRSALVARDAEARAVRRDTLKTESDKVYSFTHGEKLPDASFSLKTTEPLYASLGTSEVYFNVTNETTESKEMRLEWSMPLGGARVTELVRYAENQPFAIAESQVNDMGYFCDTGWLPVEASEFYHCGEGGDLVSCDRFNEDETNCIVEHVATGKTIGTTYRGGWTKLSLVDGAYAQTQNLIGRLMGTLFEDMPDGAIPASLVPVAHTGETVLLPPGHTAYFRATIRVPLNGRGDFAVSALGDDGSFGLVHAAWSGSWNHRIPVDLSVESSVLDEDIALPLSLKDAPQEFWEQVKKDGGDIRVVNSEDSEELPYWLSSFSHESQSGTLWVRVNERDNGTTTRVYLYVGDEHATSASHPYAPFRTRTLTPRGAVFGGSETDTALHVIAYDDDTRVRVGDGEEKTLRGGESAIFESVLSGAIVHATGPIVGQAITHAFSVRYIPAGYAGQHFVLPEASGTHELALGMMVQESVHASLAFPSGKEFVEPIFPSIVRRPVELGAGVPLESDVPVLATLGLEGEYAGVVYPAYHKEQYGVVSSRGVVTALHDGSGFVAVCGGGARSEVDGRLSGMTASLHHCQEGVPALADSVVVKPTDGLVSGGSWSQDTLVSFLPHDAFGAEYVVPYAVDAFHAVCRAEDGPIEISVYDPEGGFMASTTCLGAGVRPGKISLAPTSGAFPGGVTVVGTSQSPSQAFMLYGAVGERLDVMASAPLSRPYGSGETVSVWGDVEFVVPGEHRLLDRDELGKEKPNVDHLLSLDREFSIHDTPKFHFQYRPQTNTLLRGVREFFGAETFRVAGVVLQHPMFGDQVVPYQVVYGEGEEWTLSLNPGGAQTALRPGKYTLHIELEEGGERFVDEFDFYWGVLAINYTKSIYTPGESVDIAMGALSNNGNTICEARLRLWVTTPGGAESEVAITPSGKCSGNNVVDVPDYAARYQLDAVATGTYKTRLVRFDENDNVASQVSDSIEVRSAVPYVIERFGPTRIFPLAHYPMHIRVRANQDFSGTIVERIPGDFMVIERGNANLEWGDAEHSFMTASWPITLTAGSFVDLEYTFDAGDRSPYLYLLGPLEMQGGQEDFAEARAWQIASDAAGKMMLYLERGVPVPTGWTCVSCISSDVFFERFQMGSSTAMGAGGNATHTPTAVATVAVTNSVGVGPNTTNNTNNAPLSHTHTVTPQISGVANLPPYADLRVIQANSAGDPGTIPAGAIGVFDVASSSLPVGWFRYAPLDGRFPRAASSSVSAGSATHVHTATGTLAAPTQSGIREQNTVVNGSTDFAHTHTISATNTNAVNHEPPYVEVLYAKLNTASGTPNYLISMWDNTPPDGWVSVSGAGEVFEGKFLKGSTTYGLTGGSSSHTHASILGATTSAGSILGNYTANAANAQAPAAHVHDLDITSFSDDSHLPRYGEVIFAKRLTGIVVRTQDSYQVYANANAITPTDPWPVGGANLDENAAVDTSDIAVRRGERLRLRMNMWITNATSTVGVDAYKLQYSPSTDCPSALNWTDVGAQADGAALWRGYNNSGVADDATLPSFLLSSSTIAEAYVEENVSTATPVQIPIGGVGEWDWVIEDNTALGGVNYCFRMVESDGTPLDGYSNYPSLLTNAPPQATVIASPFSFEKVATVTPTFLFASTDPEVNDIDYEIEVSLSATFTSPVIDVNSEATPEAFENVPNPANKAPFNSGDQVSYRASALTNGVTYWVRVRAKDTNASNEWGTWSTSVSFTIDTSVTASTWFQTTRDQFPSNTLDGVTTTADTMTLIVGSTTGTVYSPSILFSQATLGTAWGSLAFTDVETSSDVKYQIEYFTSTSSWALIPDSALSGNLAGFDTSPVSLLSVDPTTYDTIRLRANLTNAGASPSINDWTLSWGYNVSTPVLYTPFDNQKVATRTPSFEWIATDPQSDSISYQISWSTSPSFTSSTTRESHLHSGFLDLTVATDTDPFASGHRVRFTIQPADILASSTVYYWRVRGRDALGANTFSFWSETRSIYVDTTVQLSTWFQTDNGQFTTDTLSSMYTYGVGSTTISTTTDEIMLAYGEGTIQTPRIRIFDGITLGSEDSALSIGSTIQWVVLKASPLIGQYILGTLGSDRDTQFQVYENGVWSDQVETGTNAPSLSRRSFDIAYETVSGRALAVSCNSNPDADYRIWTGSSWSATGTVDLSFTSNCEWVRTASNPISNEIIAFFRNTGNRYEAQVWNATTSTWGNAINLGSMTNIENEGMAVEYERSGNQALIIASNANNANFVWKAWSAGAWSATTTVTIGDDFEWGNLRRDPNSDAMVLCYVDEDGDIGVYRWDGGAFVGGINELDTGPTLTERNRRPVDCMYQSMTGYSGQIMVTYSDLVSTRYRFWNGASWVAESNFNTPPTLPITWVNQLARTAASGTMLMMAFDHVGTDYEYVAKTGSTTWTNLQTIETSSSVTASPYNEPFYLASRNLTTQGSIISTPIDFDDGVAPAWKQALWNATTPGSSTFLVQIEYYTASGTWALIPDLDLPGNSTGTSTSPINMTGLDTNTYDLIRLKGNGSCVLGVCPVFNEWTVEWAAGVRISGIARENDLSTLTTSGNIAVAVNGALQSGKTGVIDASGNWFIDNVTVFPGQTLAVFVDGALDTDEAVAVAKYTGPGDSGGMILAKRWMVAGSASTTGQTLSLADLALYDNSVSSDEDIFFDVDAGGDYNHCVSGACLDSSIYAYSNTLRFSTTSSETITAHHVRILGTLYADTNTIKVGGSWRNLGTFIPNTGTIVMNATSSTYSIDSTGAISSTFYNLTMGESGSVATWDVLAALTATGTMSVNFGTTSPGTSAITLQGNLSIGASGTWRKGSATTTFSGTVARTWSDASASKQDLGNVLVDGTAKTLTLSSTVRATNMTIGADDTLSFGGANTIFLYGDWNNTGVVTPSTGTLDLAATTTGKTITHGTSDFYNLTFSGVGGTWLFTQANATATNDVLISGSGTTTFPSGTFAVGGTLNNTGGAFIHNSGEVRMYSVTSGKTVRSSGSSFSRLTFSGSLGAWTMADTNATTTGAFRVTAGTVTLPSGVLAVGDHFENAGGVLTAGIGSVSLTSGALSRTLRFGGSSLSHLELIGGGTYVVSDTGATTTGSIYIRSGHLTLPTSVMSVGGSYTVTSSGSFTASPGMVRFAPTTGVRLISPATSTFAGVEVSTGVAASVSFSAHATTTDMRLIAGTFTLSSGVELAVSGVFQNLIGGASTTWTGSTLKLISGTSFAMNSKTSGSDVYDTLRVGANTDVSMWNSSALTTIVDASGSLYSQDHAAVDGSLYIYGGYTRTAGTEYWSVATDFDGTPLATSSHRIAQVRFDAGASASLTNAGLEILGTSTATSTISRIGSGTYSLVVASSALLANYYQFNYLNGSGLQLSGSTTISSLDFGNFELDTNGGTLLTIASTTVMQNNTLQIFNVRFALGSAIGGFNVAENDVAPATQYIRFKRHGGNIAGEAFDTDPLGNPGNIRWDDSNFIISLSGTVFSDAGVTEMDTPVCDGVTNVVTVVVTPGSTYSAPCAPGGVATGTYTISGITFSGETIMSVYLNNAPGGVKANLITKSAASDLTGINLYQGRMIVRHEDISPMGIADLVNFDRTDDIDMLFTATTTGTDTLTVEPETEFWIWNSKTFIPSGSVILNSGGSGNSWDGSFHVDNDASFVAAGAEAHQVGGRFVVDAGGVFTSASSTFTFTATTTGKLIMGVASVNFWDLIFNGSGGNWSINQTVNVGNDLLVTAGTMSGANSVNISGDSFTGGGVVAMTGGTITLQNGGDFAGGTDWSFNHLTFSGALATTTKLASSTVTTQGILTIAASHTLLGGSPSTWNIAGSGSAFVVNGTFAEQASTVRYSSTLATTITPLTYHRLVLAPSGSTGPTYTFGSGAFSIYSALIVGDGISSGTTTLATNDPAVSLFGDLLIMGTSTLVASDVTPLSVYRDFRNQGAFVSSGGTVNFLSTSTGRTITASTSPFAHVTLNSSSGGWTVFGNATTSNLSLTNLSQFTLSPTSVLEVRGTFTNSIGGGSTTWTDSTLYLNSATSYSMNATSTGNDDYGTLLVGANTDVRMWNSDASTTTVSGSGSLYSQDHGGVDGRLEIRGDYVRTTGTDYWSYATDFDGRDISGTPRAVTVYVASSSAVTISGSGALEVFGAPSASTTVDVLTGGLYSWNLTNGSTTMGYVTVRHTDTSGLNISGSPVVNAMSDVDFELSVSGGRMISVTASAIDANPLRIFMRNRFGTSSGVTTGFNVLATGAAASAWRFNLHEGILSGEAYDSDPGGDPGYLIWDDSAAQITISGNVYADEGVTPIGSPTCNGVTQNVRLRVQGAGSYTSACNSSTGAFSISSIIFNPGDTLTLFLDTAGGARAANVSLDPATNINNMHLFRDFVIVRHEQGSPITISAMDQYDSGNDSDVPFTTLVAATNTLTLPSGVGMIVWTSKVFAPGGEVTLHGNASSSYRDGTVKLYATSTWSAGSAQIHRLSGSLFAAGGATIAPSTSHFVFHATTSGKAIAASSSLTFYNLSVGGTNGTFDLSGVGTTSNDLLIPAGTSTLPANTLAVGGSFDAVGGAFLHNSGTLRFTSGVTGRTVRGAGSDFSALEFAGPGGGWTMSDANATTSSSVRFTAGATILPSRVFAVGADFMNTSGTFTASASSTLRLLGSGERQVQGGGSQFGGLEVVGSGSFLFTESAATTTGAVRFLSGTTTLPWNAFATFGAFSNQALLLAPTTTISFTATTGSVSIDTGTSPLSRVVVAGTGQFLWQTTATSTSDFSLRSAGLFTLASGAVLNIGGTFQSSIGGSQTTWTNSTVRMFGGTSFAINLKTAPADVYGTLHLENGTRASLWNATSTNYVISATSSLYSQDHNAQDGDLYIFGAYRKEQGADYWSYATDFDGTALGGSSRQVDVRFASSASAYFATGTTLSLLGAIGATTTVEGQGVGYYDMEVQSATLIAGYYQFRHTNRSGLYLSGTTTISSFNNGDFELSFDGGSMLTLASTTIDQNASAQYFYHRFATSSGVSAGKNIARRGTTTNAVNFYDQTGNLSGETYDEDGSDGCGSIRFADSACLFSDQRGFRFRNDDGGEGAPASEWFDVNWTKRQRVRISNNTAVVATNTQVYIDVPYDTEMQSDFDDIRFTDSSGTTSLDHWLESFTSSATGTFWVEVPSIPASGIADIFVYYGNGSAASASVGTSTFLFFDDFEDGNLTEYSGDTSLFDPSTSFNFERTRGLDASAGNESTGKTTDGIGAMSTSVGRDTTYRFYQYIDMSTGGSDEPCALFGIQSPLSAHDNYGVCLSPFGTDEVTIVRDAANNGRNDGAVILASTTVTYTTGWYEVEVDWLTQGNTIAVRVYDNAGALFASTSASDSTYTSGRIGFSYWGQHGGWDIPQVRKYLSVAPTMTFVSEQGNAGATWKAAENATLIDQLMGQNVRLRFSVRNTGSNLTNEHFRLQVANKSTAPNCESVATENYSDVPTVTASCGSASACMYSSTQFSDRSSTTQHLSIPTSMTFAAAQIMEDPSNETGNVSLASGQFTEVEYNFQMTPFATQNAYCFRTTKAGSPLDNYTEVAELRMLHAPFLSDFSFNSDSDIALIEGATTTIYATSTVTDFNGFADLLFASSTFYRSGLSSTTACTADNNDCYQISTSSCSFLSCSGNSCTVSCSADMYYFADPTDVGSVFAAQDWRAVLDVWDSSQSHDTASSSQDVYTLRALTVPSLLDFGGVTVGQDTGATNATTSVINSGNVVLDLDLGGDPLTSGASSVSYDRQKYATSTFTYATCPTCNVLSASTTPTFFPISVTKPTSTSSFFKDIYWGIQIPLGTAASTHSGRNYFTAQ